MIQKIELYSPWILYGSTEIYRYIKGTVTRKDEFFITNKLRKDNKVILLTGPRRIGKTTMIYRVIYRLLHRFGVDPKRILYISLDDSDIDVKNLLSYYFDKILQEKPSRLIDDVYIFIDEAQYNLESFRVAKQYVDISKNIKFLFSGSSSVRNMEESYKYLVGRVFEYKLFPIRFSEFVYQNIKSLSKEDYVIKDSFMFFMRIKGKMQSYQKEFRERIFNNSLSFEFLKEVYNDVRKYLDYIKKSMESLMIYGAFPDYVYKGVYDPLLYKSILLETLEKDLSELRISYVKFLEVLKLLAKQEFMVKTINTISEPSGLNYKTVDKIIYDLNRSFLINLIFMESSVYKRKSKFKAYFIDRGLRNSILTDFSRNLEGILKMDRDFYSSSSEALVLNGLYRILYKLGIEEPDIRFWLDKGFEVDFYYKPLSLWIEVKYGESVKREHLERLAGLEGIKIVVTKDKLEEYKGIYLVPLWLFLLLS